MMLAPSFQQPPLFWLSSSQVRITIKILSPTDAQENCFKMSIKILH